MYYGVDFRSYHTALHGILVYENEDQAEEAYGYLKSIDHLYSDDYADDYNINIGYVFEKAYDVLDEIDYRDIEERTLKGYYNDQDIKIVNNVAFDIY